MPIGGTGQATVRLQQDPAPHQSRHRVTTERRDTQRLERLGGFTHRLHHDLEVRMLQVHDVAVRFYVMHGEASVIRNIDLKESAAAVVLRLMRHRSAGGKCGSQQPTRQDPEFGNERVPFERSWPIL